LKYSEIRRQQILKAKNEAQLIRVRKLRDMLATIIQKRAKGWLWRKHLFQMILCATKIQVLLRIVRAKRIVQEERKRKNGGPEVVNMTPGGKSCLV
jgi:hypothetical protein